MPFPIEEEDIVVTVVVVEIRVRPVRVEESAETPWFRISSGFSKDSAITILFPQFNAVSWGNSKLLMQSQTQFDSYTYVHKCWNWASISSFSLYLAKIVHYLEHYRLDKKS